MKVEQPGRIQRVLTTEVKSDTVYVAGPDSSAIPSFPSWAAVHMTKKNRKIQLDLLNYRSGAAESHVLHLPEEESDFSYSTGDDRPLTFRAQRDLGVKWKGNLGVVLPVYGDNPSPRLEFRGPIELEKGMVYATPGVSMDFEGEYQLELEVGIHW